MTITVAQRKVTPRNLYPYDREWIVAVVNGAVVRHVNFEQNEQEARAFAADLERRLS